MWKRGENWSRSIMLLNLTQRTLRMDLRISYWRFLLPALIQPTFSSDFLARQQYPFYALEWGRRGVEYTENNLTCPLECHSISSLGFHLLISLPSFPALLRPFRPYECDNKPKMERFKIFWHYQEPTRRTSDEKITQKIFLLSQRDEQQ